MDIVDFDRSEIEGWDAFVRAHPMASYGHLAANFALADETPGVQNRSLVVRDGGEVVGVLPLFEVSDRELRWIRVRSLVSGAFFPAGPLISPSVPPKSTSKVLGLLLGAVRARAATLRADRVVIAYPSVTDAQPAIVRFGYSPLLHHGYSARPGVGLLIDLCKSPEQLAAARRGGCKSSVAKAQAAGATVGVLRHRDEWIACNDINVQTLGPLAFSQRQLGAIWDHFIAPGHATAYAVYADKVIAAALVTIQWRDSAYYWIGWRRYPMPFLGASHLALWSAILGSRERGCRFFELGSLEFGSAKNTGISEFKQSFGGTPYQTLAAELIVKPMKSAGIAVAKAAAAGMKKQPLAVESNGKGA
jgi:hypothetical protein